uniref:Major facilitator superfamily (MFS) profile domain-containing protein n=1 Tax=Acrobeloides nanus TaxID=290746 RepID=A0A914C9G0_9BILA
MNEKKVLFEEAAPPDAYIPPLYVQSEFNLRETELEHIPLSPLVHSDPALVPQPTSSATLECPEIENNSATPTAPPSHENVTDAPDNRKSSEPASAGMRNQSEFEINREHKLNQQRYRQYNTNSRKRRLTDIDFEGILKIIGGCNMWQVIIYLMISAHQVPHAMFALSVVYMMYPPDHWCKIPGFNKEVMENSNGNIELGWTWEKALNSGIAYPLIQNKQRRNQMMHDQCNYYVEEKEGPYASFLKENFNSTSFAFKTEPNRTLARCREWDYDRSIMKETVVTQWHRVCDDNWSRAHVHLSYSLGYLLGCIVGGYVSDTYGRKPAIYGFSILSTVFGFLLPFSREFEVFLVVRFLLATCNEAADLAAYVMCMEITGTKYRSIVGCLLQAPWACGYAFLALVAYLCKSWVTIQLITCFLHFCALIFIHHLPESPRWLIVTNRVDEAEKIIRKACQ